MKLIAFHPMNRAITKTAARILLVFLVTLLGLAPIRGAIPSPLTPANLQCDFYPNPLGVDSAPPRLDWVLQASDPSARGLIQSAYQILASSSPELLAKDKGDLWDSGKIASDQTNQIPYAGQPLKSDQAVWWKVRVWDGAGNPSSWSAPAQWLMGVLQQADWGAKWITAPAALSGNDDSTFLLRCEFPAKTGLKRATVNICGLGQYEMHLNGRNVTADVLTPGWTEYTKTCLYDTYDVTSLIQPGPNAVGILLGNGMYRVAKGGRYAKFQRSFGPLQAIVRLHLEYADGSSTTIGTDEQWRAGVSPMTFSSVYGGEDWDARLVQPGWDQPGFDQSSWLPAQPSNGPGGELRGLSRSAPPIRTFEVNDAVSHHQIKPNVAIYDLGQAASHLTRFTVHGPAGSSIKVTPSELLNPDGTLFTNNYNGKAWSIYTLAGAGNETYTSKFYYCGDRYLQVECIPPADGGEVPVVDALAGLVLHSSVTPAGAFSCSNDLFNRTYTMIHWAEVSNMMSVITDCPNRERLGWLEQDNLHGPSFWYSFDMNPLVGKIMGDIADCQLPDGLIPTHVPEYPVMSQKWRDAIEWGSTGVIMPWQQYQFTGDLDALRRNYDVMKRYVDHLTQGAKDGIAAPGLGDWTGLRASRDTPLNLISTAFYYADVQILAQAAQLLQKPEEAAAADQLAAKIRAAFNTAFFNPQTNQYGSGSQCSNAMPLALGLVDPANQPAVLANLIQDLVQRKYAMTVGEVGLPYLLRALAAAGRSDVIYTINNQSDNPGYGYQLKMGATALPETWNDGHDNTQIQFILGHIIEWFYSGLAGLQLDPAQPGFRHFTIHPDVVGDLSSVTARYESVRGPIVSAWTRHGQDFTLHAVIPPNATATIVLPTRDPAAVTEGGRPIAQAPGITPAGQDATQASYLVGSGDYTFTSTLP